MWRVCLALVVVLCAAPNAVVASEATHALALFGAPKYRAGFEHFGYVNAHAPKQGKLRLCRSDNFDSLNPFDPRARVAFMLQDLVFDRLATQSRDEQLTVYGVLAKKIVLSSDRRTLTFVLDEAARFEGGARVTTKDVAFSIELLREKGPPNLRETLKRIVDSRIESETEIRLTLAADAPWETPLFISLLPILPAHHYDADAFGQWGLRLPLGSGPYEVISARPGDQVVYRRKQDHWGRSLAPNRGRFNFDEIIVVYFRSQVAAFEAFKAGQCDLYDEQDPTRWKTAYDFPAIARGDVLKIEPTYGIPAGMSALVFNTRRPVFSDIRVRRALSLLFEAEFINNSLFSGLYRRTQSFFEGSILSSVGRGPMAREQELLAPFAGEIAPQVLDGTARQPVGDGRELSRSNQRRALELLREAGWRQTPDGKGWTHDPSGAPLRFTFSTTGASQQEARIFSLYKNVLDRAGIAAEVRQFDPVGLQKVRGEFDFDMVHFVWRSTLSPGTDLTSRWTSSSADLQRSFNLAGVRSPAADAIVKAILDARDQESFISAVRALDRVLLSGHYVIPLFHAPVQWVSHWRHLQYPEVTSDFGYLIDTWWSERAD